MSYKIELSEKTAKFLDKMQSKDQHNFDIVIKHLKNLELDPEHFGKALTGNLKGLWSYRTGDFRIIYQIQKEYKLVFIATIGHRRGIYE
jgi:mRNA interferase RelE/StbE|tara:strand:+ start:57 stop:323 length:267 start_codon:yes stop_codon:yes gene_type:complete